MGDNLGDSNCTGSLKNASDLHKKEECRRGPRFYMAAVSRRERGASANTVW